MKTRWETQEGNVTYARFESAKRDADNDPFVWIKTHEGNITKAYMSPVEA